MPRSRPLSRAPRRLHHRLCPCPPWRASARGSLAGVRPRMGRWARVWPDFRQAHGAAVFQGRPDAPAPPRAAAPSQVAAGTGATARAAACGAPALRKTLILVMLTTLLTTCGPPQPPHQGLPANSRGPHQGTTGSPQPKDTQYKAFHRPELSRSGTGHRGFEGD